MSPSASVRRWAGLGARVVLSSVFLYAGFLKWADPQSLADAIDGYRLPLGGATAFLALTLPSLEILAAVALWIPRWRGAALLTLGSLCVAFLAALIQAAGRGFVVDCGCFGEGAASVAGMVRAILRDGVLLALIVALYRSELSVRAAAPAAEESDRMRIP